jgi:hypothetical protein
MLRRTKGNSLTKAILSARKAPSRRRIQPRDFDSGIKRAKAKVKANLLGNEGTDEWDLPPKPKGMRWATYER